MAVLPEHHHFTRWWLRRYRGIAGLRDPNKVVLYDRFFQKDVGAPLRYPNELTEAIEQLKIMRARENEIMDKYTFCDNYGDT